jgi:hypothetical protein
MSEGRHLQFPAVRLLVLLSITLLLISCEIEESLKINADGSGTYLVRISVEKQFGQALPEIKSKAQQRGFIVTEEPETADRKVVLLTKNFSNVSELNDDTDTFSLIKTDAGGLKRGYLLTIFSGTNVSANGWQKRTMRIVMPVAVLSASDGHTKDREVEWDSSRGGTLVVEAAGTPLPFGLTLTAAGLMLLLLIVVSMGFRSRRLSDYRCTVCGSRQALGALFCTACGTKTTVAAHAAPGPRISRVGALVVVAGGLAFTLIAVNAQTLLRLFHTEAPAQNSATGVASGTQSSFSNSASAVVQAPISSPAAVVSPVAMPATASTASKTPSNLFAVDAHTVALWHLNESAGATVVDETGVNNGTAAGTTIVDGRFGPARQFRGGGAGEYVAVPDHASLRGMAQMSIEAWIYPTGFDLNVWNGEEAIVGKGDHTGTANVYSLGITRNGGSGSAASAFTSFTLGFSLTAGGRGVGVASTVEHQPNQWYYLVGTYDGNIARVYVNGVLEATSEPVAEVVVTTTDPLFINNQTWSSRREQSNGRMAGTIDEVRISNIARSPTEILHAASLQRGDHPGEASW